MTIAQVETIVQRKPQEGRLFVSTQYALPADEQERKRLNLQHEVLIEVLDGRLMYPPVTVGENDWILDNATGSGIWISEASKQVPQGVQFRGVDMSPHLWPATPPTNVVFEKRSILNHPAEWTDRFAFAHQRLLLAALTRAEWTQALSELYRVIRPGGCVQLGEWMPRFSEGVLGAAHWPVRERMYQHRGLFYWAADHLTEMLREAGFECVREERKEVPMAASAGSLGKRARNNRRDVFLAFKTPVLASGYEGTGEEYEAATLAMFEELETLPVATATYVVAWGYKPNTSASQ